MGVSFFSFLIFNYTFLLDDKSESSIDNSYEAVSNQNNNYSSSSGHFSFSLSGNSDKFKQHFSDTSIKSAKQNHGDSVCKHLSDIIQTCFRHH